MRLGDKRDVDCITDISSISNHQSFKYHIRNYIIVPGKIEFNQFSIYK